MPGFINSHTKGRIIIDLRLRNHEKVNAADTHTHIHILLKMKVDINSFSATKKVHIMTINYTVGGKAASTGRLHYNSNL